PRERHELALNISFPCVTGSHDGIGADGDPSFQPCFQPYFCPTHDDHPSTVSEASSPFRRCAGRLSFG
ncbi:MAG: hypothetical protein ACRELY_08585, partial [Polyangiaceae bacterium]